MKSTINYNRQSTLTSLPAQVKQTFLHFISQNRDVIAALSGLRTPYGYNLFRTVGQPTAPNAETAHESLDRIQQQLDLLSGQVTLLRNKMDATRFETAPVERTRTQALSPVNPIGIHRFRALQAR